MSQEDKVLVDKVKSGDSRAFELLVRKYQGRVAAVISRSVSDATKVQDLTQEAFIKAFRALPKFRGDSAFYTWLYRIAVNTAKNHLMASGRGLPISDVELENAEGLAPQLRDNETPERAVLRSELMENLDRIIQGLSPAMREAVTLRDVKGLTYEEIAEKVGCPIGTVRSRIFRGRQEIVDRLKGYVGNSRGA
ncbi:RNA polymerase sigma factor RpoE [Magnetococcales bacterium HHB-1]